MKTDGIELAVKTPAFVYDVGKTMRAINHAAEIIGKRRCRLLFPMKSFAISDALCTMACLIDGFSASSLFEAKYAKAILGSHKSVHFTTPGLRPDEIEMTSELCTHISFNSLSQWERFRRKVSRKVSCGLRVNPELAFVEDERYNPCRKGSKLGVPLSELCRLAGKRAKLLDNVEGIHFHSNCESRNFDELGETVRHIDGYVPSLLGTVDWVNLGGGYLIDGSENVDSLSEIVSFLTRRYDIEVFFEPGKAIVGKSGYIVSSVVDLFPSDRGKIAVLDTSVNHMPEVFEYQYKPEVLQESENGKYSYVLAGASCLAGDFFGEYRFEEPLKIGSRIVFEDMGAYTLVKANMFNGINLPTIYAYTLEGKLEMKREFTYEDFLSRCGANGNVPL